METRRVEYQLVIKKREYNILYALLMQVRGCCIWTLYQFQWAAQCAKITPLSVYIFFFFVTVRFNVIQCMHVSKVHWAVINERYHSAPEGRTQSHAVQEHV